jgi:hypothetical protein
VILRPTKTRLRVLRAVADGDVWQRYTRSAPPVDDWLGRRVTARCTEMEHAGWIRLLPPCETGAHYFRGSRRWMFTPAGWAVLQQHGGSHVG